MSAILRRFFLITSLFTLAAAAVGYGLWRHGVIQNWVLTRAESAVLEIYNSKVKDHIPFEVEKIEYDRNWSELVVGRLNEVSITLKKDELRIHLKGPLRFPAIRWATFQQLYRKARDLPLEHSDQDIELDYSPVVSFESLKPSGKSSGPAPLPDPFSADLAVNLSGEVNELLEANIELLPAPHESKWKWKEHGIDIEKPHLSIHWKNRAPVQAHFEAASFAYQDNVRIVSPHANLELPLNLKPFTLGPWVTLDWNAESGEALFGDHYFSLNDEPLHGQAELLLNHSNWNSLNLAIGKSNGHQLRLKATPHATTAQIEVHLDPLSLKDAIPTILKSTANAGAPFNSISFLQELAFQDGKLSLTAQGSVPLKKSESNVSLPDFSKLSTEGKLSSAKLELDDASFLWPTHQLAVKKLHLSIPYTSHKGFEGEISINRFGYRKLRGKLLPTRISFIEEGKGKSSFRIGEKGSRIPLDIDGLVLKIDSIAGTAKLFPLQYNLVTSVSLEPASAEQVIGPLCIVGPGHRIPPAKIHMSFPKIEISPAVTDLTGYIRADLFGGFIQIDEMGMFDFLSPVPEIDFNLTMDGIDLHSLGDWVNFGEMDGTLSAYAHDVVFQASLPTQYDFEIKLKPLHHSDVVFSPTAMKNFARLFTKEGIDHIPGYAQWLAFGWPSRLLGGYDIDYAGVHIRSEDGYIHLETLDPVTDSDPYNPQQKHFILYGRRFKIPLKSSRYPLILDAPAMGNYVHQMFGMIQELAKKKKGETHREDEIQSDNSDQETLPAACIPSDLSHM